MQKVWAGLNQLTLPCGNSSAQLIEKILPSCGIKPPELSHLNGQLVGTKEIAGTSCPTSQAQPEGSSEPSVVECSARRGVLAYDTEDDDEQRELSVFQNKSTAAELKVFSDKKIKEILENIERSDPKSNPVKQYEKSGGYEKAKIDFDSLDLSDIKQYPNGTIVGRLPDGRSVNVRPTSDEKRPTIEVINGPNNRIKIRY